MANRVKRLRATGIVFGIGCAVLLGSTLDGRVAWGAPGDDAPPPPPPPRSNDGPPPQGSEKGPPPQGTEDRPHPGNNGDKPPHGTSNGTGGGQKGTGGGGQGNDGRPPRPPRLEDVVQSLGLDPATQQKVNDLATAMHQKEQAARDELLEQLKPILTADQLAKVQAAVNHAPPPHAGGGAGAAGGGGAPRAANTPAATGNAVDESTAAKGTVIIHGGFDTDGRDHGRPVVLIAAALDVPTEVFRQAFTGVTPAGPGATPEEGQVRLNKQALMKALSPYGVTDERLNAVSNYYRYSRSRGEMWKTAPAAISAVIESGRVTGFTIQNGGAGYSSPPTITVAGYPRISATTTLNFGTDFAANGSIKSVDITPPER